MSSRALRRLQGDDDILKSIPVDLDEELESEEENFQEVKTKKKKKKKKKKEVSNPFDILNDDECENDADNAKAIKENECEKDVHGTSDNKTEDEIKNRLNDETSQSAASNSSKKKKKKQKKKVKEQESGINNEAQAKEEDEIDASIREVNRILGLDEQTGGAVEVVDPITSDMRALLNVEHRNLNPENEMRRIFGSRVVQENSRQRARHRTYHRSTKLVQPRDNWPPIGRTGLSMSLSDSRPNHQMFTFEHSHQYQQTEFKFLEAVESLNPENIANLLHVHPYHINGILQLSDIFKMSEDMQMAAELIERGLYAFEHAFHPSFSLTTGTCRVDFRRQENRALYLCLFRHLTSIGQRGCYRTALEFCKLLLSLDPDGDPLCVLLMIDFYALRAEQYTFLIRMYHEWEAHRNLTQLPNFAFSVPLAMFHLASQNEESTEAADILLQSSLMMFPGLLMPLLDKCSVNPDSTVTGHPFFGPAAQNSQTEALKQLIALYIGRTFPCWKEPDVVLWLERNVKEVLARVDRKDPLVEESKQKRSVRYQGTPRNIYRHIIISEIKDATAALPPELTASPILTYDPLPPPDNIVSYDRPSRGRQETGGNSLSLFLRSLLPNYNVNDPVPAEEGAAGGDNPDRNSLQRGIGVLMDAMRDLLNNIQPVAPPVENQHDGEERDEEEWD